MAVRAPLNAFIVDLGVGNLGDAEEEGVALAASAA
jgi:hypothetical protein